MIALMVAVLSQMVVATALPAIVAELGDVRGYAWIYTAYALASCVTVPIWGRLSDIHGRRPFFVAGIVLFMVGGLLGATAQSLAQVIAARVLQGLGAGGVIPLAMATVADLVPASRRGRWQGAIGAVYGVGSIAGPLVGGWISDHADWRWIFVVTFPLALVSLALVAATLRVPPHPQRDRRLDIIGAGLLAGGLATLLFAVAEWGASGRLASVAVPGAVGAVLIALLVRRERRVPEPIVPVELLADPVFRRLNVLTAVVGAAMFVLVMFVPLFSQAALATSATGSGLVLVPLMAAMLVVSLGSGEAIARTGRYRWAIVPGPPLIGAGFALLATLDEGSSLPMVAAGMVVAGVGFGLLNQNLVLVLQNAVPSRHLGSATAAAQLFRHGGGTVGVAAMGAVLSAGLAEGAVQNASAAGVADAIHPVFLLGVPAMALAWWLVLRVPELPLRATVREEAAVPV